MKLVTLAVLPLLFATMFLPSMNVVAQARSTVKLAPEAKNRNRQEDNDKDDGARASKLIELDAWLRRLVGSFRVSGSMVEPSVNSRMGNPVTSRNPRGSIVCTGFGTGPGLHCSIDVAWAPIVESDPLHTWEAWSEAYNTLKPAMMLFAMDPDQLELQLMLVDDHGIADTWSGRLNGDTAVFTESVHGCWGYIGDFTTSVPHCPRRLDIVAKPKGENEAITLSMTLPNNGSIEFVLRRLPGEAASLAK